MSNFLAPIEQDPTFLFLQPVQQMNANMKKEDIDIMVGKQLKAQTGFDLTQIAEKGQLSLLQISDKYGAMFFSHGAELFVVANSQLNQMVIDGKLPDALVSQESNKTNEDPIIYLKVCDKTDTLFVQHQGDDYLIIADLPSVILNPKNALDDAKRVKMDLGGVDVRQISVSQNLATVVTRNDAKQYRMLLINHDTAVVVASKDEVTTAVFSADGKSIIAGKDSMEENLLVLDLNLQPQNSIKLSFPGLSEDIAVDNYRVFWISEPHKNNTFVFAAYFEDESSVDDNLGRTLMIWIGDDIAKDGQTLDSLKQTKKIMASVGEIDHQNDDIIPSFNVEYYENPASDETIGLAMQNHADCPYLFKIDGSGLKECYELTSKSQLINRPIDEDSGDVMDA